MPKPEWTVLVADDEPAARRGVRQLLAPYPEFRVAGECRDGRETLAALDTLRPDVLFLDIQMPEIDGFEVIRRRGAARMPALVFLTAYDEFAIAAFEAEALDYLLKPVSEARFAATIDRLARRLASEGPRIAVTTSRGTLVFPLHEIDWFEAADNYARLWSGGKSYLLRQSLAELERRAPGFVRAHRSALIRVAGVKEVGDDTAVLSCGATVPVSRRRRAELLAAVRSRR
ncbi:MAG TPA: LytTR family DNA-binding domain-containing protein [Thermoanaerobaculia bacterium]|jgi:two-component system LytT family response regulator